MLFAGLGFAVVGVAIYVAQVFLHRLATPWYLPLTGTLGALFVIGSLWQRRGVWRVLTLVCVLLLAFGEWGFVLGTRLPAYSGPVAVGKPFPDFSTTRADGEAFTRKDLVDQDTVLVFFRGRW
ncbi:MAG TPA: hypothetical protein VG826_24010 [Pirellulales bacterium]|nr:hypothetical protein [Pirellulales bacterium]